jgi:hypothetical protein
VARGDSVIRVSIIGDAKKLVGAVNDADKATGGLLKSTAKVVGGSLIAFKAVDAVFDTISGGLDNADTLADAVTRIEGATSPAFAARIHDIAFDFTDIGLSAPEFATLAAKFADFAKSAQISEPLVESITPDIVAIAQAVAATTGKTVDEVIDDIGKAAAGNQKPLRDLGIVIDTSLNPDDQILSILDQLKKKFPDVQKATDDLKGSQDELNAKWDNFTTKLGEALEGPLKGLLDVFSNILDDIPETAKGFEDLGGNIVQFAKNVLGPLGNVRDALEGILNLLNRANSSGGSPGATVNLHSRNPGGSGFSDAEIAAAQKRNRERNGLGT